MCRCGDEVIGALGLGLDALFARLPWLRKALVIAGAAGLLALAWHLGTAWHARQIVRVTTAARLAGRAEQKAVDRAAFIAARDAATAQQARIVKAAEARGAVITERISHDFEKRVDAIDRAAAAKLRAHTARQADRGDAGAGAATQVPGAATGDPEAYCTAAGWLPFGRALTMAQDAEHDAEQARQCAAWVGEQAKAWPQ